MSVSQKPLIVAHRGASHDAPENTLSSFKLAWEQNADVIECDIWMTKDQQLACIHDKTTKRTADKNLDVTEAGLDELKELDAGRWKGRQWKGERIPLLEEVLVTVPKGKKIFIEIKDNISLLPVLGKLIKKTDLLSDQIVILCFSQDVARESKKIMPEIKTLLGLEKFPATDDLPELLKALNADGIDIKDSKSIGREFVEELHAAGFEVHVWTVNRRKSFIRYCALGVDSVTTDKPAVMRSVN